MEKGEPTLVPEWYKGERISSSSNSSNHHSSSANPDDQGVAPSPRNRSSPSMSEHDILHPSFLADRTSNSSNIWNRGTNGSMGHDKDDSKNSRLYNSFNRHYHDRVRERSLDHHVKKTSVLLANGYSNYSDVLMVGRAQKDTSLQPQTKVAGMQFESLPKKPNHDANNGILSAVNMTTIKSSFERDFPSLGTNEKLGPPERGKVLPTALNTVPQSLPLCSSVSIGHEGWTSALAEVPSFGGNSSMHSPAQQFTPASTLALTHSGSPVLNMAEALVKEPARACASPQSSIDTQRLEELAIKQSRQLIPVTPTTPKTSVFNSSERLKAKGARSGNANVLAKPQSSSQHANRGTAKPDVSKMHQVGNFQVLNRDRIGPTSTSSKVPGPKVNPKDVNPVSVAPNSLVPSSPKLRKDAIQSTFVEKRPFSQDRISFFNTIRRGSQASNSSASQEQCPIVSSSEKPVENTVMENASASKAKESSAFDSINDCSMMNYNGLNGNGNNLIDTEKISSDKGEESSCSDNPDEEEARFLRSLGWQEDAGEEALTAEEIEAFVREYKLRPRTV